MALKSFTHYSARQCLVSKSNNHLDLHASYKSWHLVKVTSHVGGGALEIHPHLLNCLSKVPQVQFGSFVDGFVQLNDNANNFNYNIKIATNDFYNSSQKPYVDSNNHPTPK